MLFSEHAQKDPAASLVMLLREDCFDVCKGAPGQPNRFANAKAICAQLDLSIFILARAQPHDDCVRHQSRMQVSRRKRADARGALDVPEAEQAPCGANEEIIREQGPQHEHPFARMGDHPLIAGTIDLEFRTFEVRLGKKLPMGFASHANPLWFREFLIMAGQQASNLPNALKGSCTDARTRILSFVCFYHKIDPEEGVRHLPPYLPV